MERVLLQYDGEYKYGKKNGKAKEYNWFGKLIFEGEYLNGDRLNGKIYKNVEVFEIKEKKDK